MPQASAAMARHERPSRDSRRGPSRTRKTTEQHRHELEDAEGDETEGVVVGGGRQAADDEADDVAEDLHHPDQGAGRGRPAAPGRDPGRSPGTGPGRSSS